MQSPDISRLTRDQLVGLLVAIAARLANDTAPPVEDKLLTAEQAAERLGVSRQFVYRLARTRSGRDLVRKIGDATLRFSSAALDAYIKTTRRR